MGIAHFQVISLFQGTILMICLQESFMKEAVFAGGNLLLYLKKRILLLLNILIREGMEAEFSRALLRNIIQVKEENSK